MTASIRKVSTVPIDVEDTNWDKLPPPLQIAASKLGYTERLWDLNLEPAQCDRGWSQLTSEQQEAAMLIGFDQKKWDRDVYSEASSWETEDSDDHKPDAEDELDGQIKTLQDDIVQRQASLKTLLEEKEGTAYARMLRSHEDCVNSHLTNCLTDLRPDLHQNKCMGLKQSSLQLIQTAFLNEYYHALPACMALILNCILFLTLHQVIMNAAQYVCHNVICWASGWHIIDNNFNSASSDDIFFSVLLLLSLFLTRITGMLYSWDNDWTYQRRIHFHIRNRWHLRCWDVRIMNWFGGEMSNTYGRVPNEGPGRSKGKTHMRRLKNILDIFSFYLCSCCVEHFVIERGSSIILNVRGIVLEGLPSRQFHQWTEQFGQDHEGQLCNGSGSAEECSSTAILDQEFMPDILNWAMNSNRCGWGNGDNDDEDEDDDDEGGEEEEERGKYDNHLQHQGNESNIFAQKPRHFKPWKQFDEEWVQQMNNRDDQYLRSSISMETYYDFVGDPFTAFIRPAREELYLIAVSGLSFALLHWLGASFNIV